MKKKPAKKAPPKRMRVSVADRINELNPCPVAARWASKYTSPAKAWKECPNWNWLLWLLESIAYTKSRKAGRVTASRAQTTLISFGSKLKHIEQKRWDAFNEQYLGIVIPDRAYRKYEKEVNKELCDMIRKRFKMPDPKELSKLLSQ